MVKYAIYMILHLRKLEILTNFLIPKTMCTGTGEHLNIGKIGVFTGKPVVEASYRGTYRRLVGRLIEISRVEKNKVFRFGFNNPIMVLGVLMFYSRILSDNSIQMSTKIFFCQSFV